MNKAMKTDFQSLSKDKTKTHLIIRTVSKQPVGYTAALSSDMTPPPFAAYVCFYPPTATAVMISSGALMIL